MTDIPTVRVDHFSLAKIRAYVIADNKLAENASWDRQLLALESTAQAKQQRISVCAQWVVIHDTLKEA